MSNNNEQEFCYVRPVRRIDNEIRSGPVRSAVSDRSRTDLGSDRFDDFFRRRENFDDAKSFEKKVRNRRNGAIDFIQESSKSELSSGFLSCLMFENSLATFGRIQPIVPGFIALYPHSGTNLGTIGRIRQKVAYEVLNFRYF